jgi:hypothetical protein
VAYAASAGSAAEQRGRLDASTRAEHVVLPRLAQAQELPLGAPEGAPVRGPFLRVFLVEPQMYQPGPQVFRGYVENNHSTNLTQVRLELTHTDGSVTRHAIAATLAPGERVPFEFRGTPDVQWPPRFHFMMRP